MLKKRTAGSGRIGLVFERERIALGVVLRDGDQLRLDRCAVLAIDAEGGPDAAAAVLRGASLPRLPISIVLRPEDYQLALVEAPNVPPAELKAAMRWRLKDAIDFRVEDAMIDVFDLPAQNRGSQGRMMYAVAARREAIEKPAAALTGLPGFDVVDVPELCLRNLAAKLPHADGGVALLHLNAMTATVILVRGSTFYFARHMDLSAGPTGIVLEVQRSLDYYERHFDQPPIVRIAISPGGTRAVALAAELNRETGFEVAALQLNTLLDCPQHIETEVEAACLLAVGAALREERRTL